MDTILLSGPERVSLREQSLFMGGGAGANRGGHKFQCKQIEGGAKFQCKPLEGGQDFSAPTFECQPKATNIYPKKIWLPLARRIYFNIEPSCFMPTLHFQDFPKYDLLRLCNVKCYGQNLKEIRYVMDNL